MLSLTVNDDLFYVCENKTRILTEKGRKGEKAKGVKEEMPGLFIVALSPLRLLTL
jgi:hypothetical protein